MEPWEIPPVLLEDTFTEISCPEQNEATLYKEIKVWGWKSDQKFHKTFDKCDLLREKGPTAVKRRFKTQLTAFYRKMLCNIFTFAS